MEFSAQQIAQLIGGTVEGNPDVMLSAFDKIESAGPKALTFLSNPKYAHYVPESRAGAILVSTEFQLTEPTNATLIRVAEPYAALAQLMTLVDQLTNPQPTGIEEPSFIAPGVEIPEEAYIGAFAYIGQGAKLGKGVKIYPQAYVGPGVTIGDGTIIYAGVKIYRGCQIGSNCILHSGAVIGADGFGHAPNPDGTYSKIPQMGRVVIADNVEIGANTTVDRATMGQTFIGRGTKLDNLIQVAHNVEIGENTVMAAQVGIAGSTKIGSNCMFGGQVGIAGHISIGNHVNVGAQSGMHSNAADGSTLMGSPVLPARQWMRQQAQLTRVGDLIVKVRELEKKIKELEN
ncbi:MAG: UDP-3-O-(3-hydroxymyristoyl)glucosamine N-acyltransferase [Bacteroidales bacterium]|nr:UDP-3-O-(3-hydroxymyristoyl)glucosamine N-acyltransferase [Bacteroidales bacterium]MBD5342270.1 UDP-3-O-(3-hydroxymyristoyl)glucosamine N-acyltransferase [Bacteroides sp.]MBD5363485.1 UDP-3-O-(3-hydroxymyristoyl)glucosamine N-acyltransferase [Bacteroides sp.]MBD5373110.1 UDP-3-O-(3-hydroxymyristoyl)glucosamine N-acyltransferase [Bacteroides sp.]MDE6033775.1 UDP-3-O-(3-hydroxymyristoyl)glucosamine N-acyltransferase [Muribaculaceae bacterium]